MAKLNNNTITVKELPLILQLDVMGNPSCWITFEKAAYYYTKDLVAWSMNATDFTIFGGNSRMTGDVSTLTMETIIAIKGKVSPKQFARATRVPLTNKTLFRRDNQLCAYCGNSFSTSKLSRDHVHPTSKGGPDIWTNVVTACHHCNKIKDNKTLEQANMKLLYVPYAPNKAEHLILQNKKILADQMEFLLAKVSSESRLLKHN